MVKKYMNYLHVNISSSNLCGLRREKHNNHRTKKMEIFLGMVLTEYLEEEKKENMVVA
jgi:hypothetical protein